MLDKELFHIGSFKFTVLILILVILLIVVIIAAIAFRRNYILQVKLSRMMDPESNIHNTLGTVQVLKKRRKKIKKACSDVGPALVVVQLDNLGGLYVGYPNRNDLMRNIATIFRYDLQDKEFVTRLDFNKFCVVMCNRDRNSIKQYVQSLNKQLNEFEFENYGLYTFFLTCGVYENAPLDYPKQDVELALATLTYATIKDGNIYYYSEEVLRRLERVKLINNTKESALQNNQFVPYVQPKIDFKTGRVVGGEMLVRWVDGEQNFVYNPDEFIPLFENNGFIKKVDMLMFERTCELSATLRSRGKSDILLSCNFSRLTLNSQGVVEEIMSIANTKGITPANIEIELSESAIMESSNAFNQAVTNLRNYGFRVSMDDFGKKYSSLALLSDNTFDSIKVDRYFFENNLSSDKEKHISKNIIDLLSNSDCDIVLEGIETKAVLDYLATVDRNLILQGYYFSKPIPVPKFESFLDTVFNFNYPEIIDVDMTPAPVAEMVPAEVESMPNATIQALPNGNTSINISGLGNATNHNHEIDEMRRQMDEMRHQFEKSIEEQKRLAHEEEMKRMRDEIERLRNQPKEKERGDSEDILALRREIEYLKNSNRRDYRDDEIERLRRQLEDMRYSNRYYERGNTYYVTDRVHDNTRDRELDLLQRQIDELKDQKEQQSQQQIDINELIARLSQSQNDNARHEVEKAQAEAKSLKDKLEQERKEKEKLEAMLKDIEEAQKEEPEEPEVSEAEKEKEQEEADKKLNLDLSALIASKDDDEDDDDDDDDDDDEVEKLKKPNLTLEEIEAIIKNFQERYRDDWNQRAKAELKDGYYEVIDGLRYYKGKQKRTFIDKIKKASPEVKQLFNMVKNEFMKYGVTNKLTNSYDCFYKGRNQIGKISLTTSKLKVYVAADPSNPKYRSYPHKDMSEKKAHARTPYYALVKSQLSVKRIGNVIADAMEQAGLDEVGNYKPIDYATKYKFYKSDQK